MPFVGKEAAPKSLRIKYEAAYKKQLRQSLVDPSVPDETKTQIRETLKTLG